MGTPDLDAEFPGLSNLAFPPSGGGAKSKFVFFLGRNSNTEALATGLHHYCIYLPQPLTEPKDLATYLHGFDDLAGGAGATVSAGAASGAASASTSTSAARALAINNAFPNLAVLAGFRKHARFGRGTLMLDGNELRVLCKRGELRERGVDSLHDLFCVAEAFLMTL